MLFLACGYFGAPPTHPQSDNFSPPMKPWFPRQFGNPRHCLSLAGIIVVNALGMAQAGAATLTWNGLGTNDDLLSGLNWSGGIAPAASGDSLIFTGNIRLAPTLSTALSVASITFNSAAAAFTLGGTGVYTLTAAGGLVNSSSGTQTIGNALVFGANQTWSTNVGSLVLNGNINNNTALLTVSSTGTTTLNGVLSGAGGLTKSGSGTLLLNGANIYSGTTTLSGGNVVLGNDSAVGTSSLKFSSSSLVVSTGVGGATLANAYTLSRNLTFSGSNNLTLTGTSTLSGNRSVTVSGSGVLSLNGVISGSNRTLTKTGSGTLILAGNNTMKGVTLSAGTLYATNANALSGGSFSLGTGSFGTTSALAFANALTLAGNTTFVGSNAITFNGNAALTATRSLAFNGTTPVTFNGVISGSTYGINKAGAGTLVLAGTSANTFNGLTKINDGQISFGKTAGLNAFAGVLEIGDGLGATASALGQLNASNQIPDASTVAIYADGQLKLQTFSDTIGALTLLGGSVTGTGSLTLGGDVTFSGTAGASSSISSAVVLGANRIFLVNSNGLTGTDLAITGNISGAFSATKTGAGTLSLSGASGFSGGYFANAGGTLIGNSTALGTAAANLGDVSGTNSASLLFDTTSGLSLANGITVRSGNSGVSKLGGLNISGINTFSGALTLNNSVTLTAEAGGEVAFTGGVTGTGGFTKIGAGTVRLSGSNSSSGAMLISAGILALGATNALGSGALTVDGGILDFGASRNDSVGTLVLDNGGSINGSGTSTLTSTGNFDLRSGTVQIALAGTGNLTKTTGGVLALAGTDVYTGSTTISAGSVLLGNANVLPASTALTVSSGATLNLQNFATQVGSLAGGGDVQLGSATFSAGGSNASTTFSGVVNGTGGLTKTGTGTLTLSGSNLYSGATTISGGSLLLGKDNALNSLSGVTVNSAIFNLGTFSQSIASLSGTGTVTIGGGTLTIGSTGASSSFSGGIGGNGAIIKSGAGTLSLTGVNSTTSTLDVSGGTLALSGLSGAVASIPTITLQNGGTLQLDSSTTENANRIGNSAAIRLNGGTLQLISDANGTSETVGALTVLGSSSTVNVTHNGGALTASVLTFSSLGTVSNGATVNFTATGGILGVSALGPQIYITGQANGLLGGWATVGADPAEVYLYGIRAFSSYYEGSLGININDTTKIVRLSSSSVSGATTLSNAGITTDLGLNLTDVTTVDLGTDSSRTLNLSNGSLIKSTAVTSTIQGAGKLTAGGSLAGNLNASVTSGSSLLINSIITDNASASVGLTKGDLGTLTLGAANTFTGNVFVNGGILSISAENNLGSGSKDVVFNGGTLKITSSYTASSSKIFKVSAGLTGTLDVSASQTLTLANTAGMLATADTSSIFINQGPGSLIIPNANAGFLGILRINQGTVEIRNPGSLGTGSVQLNGGTLSLSQNSSTAFNNNLVMQADSSIRVSRQSGSGGVIHTLGNLDLGSRTLTVTGDGSASLALASITLSGAGTLNPSTADIRAGVIGGAFDLTKTGAGALILTAASTYSGSTFINGGILRLATANVIPDGTAVTLASGTSFDTAGFSETIGSLTGAGNVSIGSATLTTGAGGSSTYSGVISGTGGLTKAGSGTTFTLAGPNTFTGATQINAGTLAISASNNLTASSDLTVASGATFLLNNNSPTLASLTGAGTIALGSGSLTTGANSSSFSGAITGSGGLVKSGAGTLTLSGTSTFSGNTSIQAGSVIMDSASALGSTAGSVSVSSGAVLSLENGISVGSKGLSLSGDGISSGGALINISGSNSWSGNLSLGAATTIASTAGSLVLGGAADLATFALSVKGSGSTTFSGIVTGSTAANVTALSNNGVGTLILSGSNTYTGLTTVSQGILQVNNTTALGATGSGNGTSVASGATLLLQPASSLAIGNELLTLNGSGFGGNGALRSQSGDNNWDGNLALGSDSSLRVDTGSTLTLNGTLGDSGSARTITKDGSGILILAGTVPNTGPILVQSGSLQLATAGRISDLSLVNVASGATFNLDNYDETIGSLTGSGSVTLGTDIIVVGGDLSTGGDNSSATFSGVISELGSLIKLGSGTQTLAGSNSYTGVTTISGGVLSVSALANGGSNSGIGASINTDTNLVLNGGTLRYTGTTQSSDRNYTIGIDGGTFDASGSGALTLAGAATLAGIDAARTVTLAGTNTNANTIAASFTDNGLGPTSFAKNGSGTWVVSGAQSFTGSTTISAGTLRIASVNRLSDSSAVTVSSGGTLDLNNFADTIGSLAGGGNVTLGSAALTAGADNSSTTFSGTISGTGSFTKTGTGTQTLSGSSSYTGITTISGGGVLAVATLANGGSNSGIGASSNAAANLILNGGTLAYTGGTQTTDRNFTIGTSGGSFDASGSGALTLAGAATLSGTNTARTLNLTGSNTNNNTFAATIANNGNGTTALVKSGSGTWVLTGAETYTGTTTVSGGTLTVNSGASLGATTTTVASGAILKNNGTIAGPITNNGLLTGNGTFSGAVVITATASPGNGIGIQSFSNGLRYNSTSAYYWELASNTASLGLAGSDYDQIRETSGVLQVDAGASLNLVFDMVSSGVNFSNVFWTTNHNWSVATLSGSATADPVNAAFIIASISQDAFGHNYSSYGSFTTSISSGNEQLNWVSAIPEPSTLALGAMGALSLLRRRREMKASRDFIS